MPFESVRLRTALLLCVAILVAVIGSEATSSSPQEPQAVAATSEGKPISYLAQREPMVRDTTTTSTTLPPTTTTTAPPPTTTTTSPPPPPPPSTEAQVRSASQGINWWAIANCESGLGTGAPQWHINTGNGYSGGLQFSPSSWNSAGGQQYAAYAYQATPEQQIATAIVLSNGGTNLHHWPVCGKYG